MKLINSDPIFVKYDMINDLAISQLEQIGIMEATQEQIDLMEKIIRISFERVKPKYVEKFLENKPRLKLV